MRLSSLIPTGMAFITAAAVSLIAANYSVQLIEDTSEIGVREALDRSEMPWAEVHADGLRLTLSGTAPTEAARFQALTTAGTVVDAARVVDEFAVENRASLAPPRFSAEILRNHSGVSINGLIPKTTEMDAVMVPLNRAAGEENVSNFLETADYPEPAGWNEAIFFAISAIAKLPRAKASVEAGHVSITAAANSPEEKARLQKELRRTAPPGLKFKLDISAPRPVITPFTLRFEMDAEGARFDACSADTLKAHDQIVTAAKKISDTFAGRCTIGLGTPSPKWAEAAELAMTAVSQLGGGSVSMSDADITLVALPEADQKQFERVVGELENALPGIFALSAELPQPEAADTGPTEFFATLSPEGQVQLRGRLSGAPQRELANSYAKARFGSDKVYTAARVVEGLPSGWTQRVLTGLEALSMLSNGSVTVTPEKLSVAGNTGNPNASTEIASLLAGKLGDATQYDIDVTYQEKLDPVLGLPTPDECVEEIANIQKVAKISFEPGSATIDATALETMDDIAEILKTCSDLPLEIQGHTDSQGREEMNLSLSQSRAESVLNELRARRVLTSTFVAKGYGEQNPIADNKTEAGREDNRRIEFHLIRPDTVDFPEETTLESMAEPSDADDTAEEPASPQEAEQPPQNGTAQAPVETDPQQSVETETETPADTDTIKPKRVRPPVRKPSPAPEAAENRPQEPQAETPAEETTQ